MNLLIAHCLFVYCPTTMTTVAYAFNVINGHSISFGICKFPVTFTDVIRRNYDCFISRHDSSMQAFLTEHSFSHFDLKKKKKKKN